MNTLQVINQGRGSNADRSCCDTVHTVLRIYGAASTVLHCLLAYPRAVLLVLLERDLLYILLRACYSIGERVYLDNLYSGIHSTHQRSHRYNWIAYRCLALVGLSTGQCLLYCVFRVLSRLSCSLSRLSFAPSHIFANLRQLTLHIWGCRWGCTRAGTPRLMTP